MFSFCLVLAKCITEPLTAVILLVKTYSGLPYVLKTRCIQCGRELLADSIFLSCCGCGCGSLVKICRL